MRMKGIIAPVIVCNILAGCGSISTIPKSDYIVRSELGAKKTKCDWIPRLYSGVAFDFCRLHAKPSEFYTAFPLDFYIFDFMFSGVVDTVALPYTGYLQYKNGSIRLGD